MQSLITTKFNDFFDFFGVYSEIFDILANPFYMPRSYGSWKLPIQSVPINIDVVSLNLNQDEVYNIM